MKTDNIHWICVLSGANWLAKLRLCTLLKRCILSFPLALAHISSDNRQILRQTTETSYELHDRRLNTVACVLSTFSIVVRPIFNSACVDLCIPVTTIWLCASLCYLYCMYGAAWENINIVQTIMISQDKVLHYPISEFSTCSESFTCKINVPLFFEFIKIMGYPKLVDFSQHVHYIN